MTLKQMGFCFLLRHKVKVYKCMNEIIGLTNRRLQYLMLYKLMPCYLSMVLFSCHSNKHVPVWQQKIESSEVFANNHWGLVVFDPKLQQKLYDHNGNKYFTPASNSKLYSFFAGVKTLGDSIPALHYVERSDSLIFWGTGDPCLLHPDMPKSKVWSFLKNHPAKTLCYYSNNQYLSSYGVGWAWDDYSDYYQTEITALPIYGNIARFTLLNSRQWQVSPKGFLQKSQNNRKQITRDLHQNTFQMSTDSEEGHKQDIPFITSDTLTLRLLSDTLRRSVVAYPTRPMDKPQLLYSLPVDTLYRRMLQVSDNMLAEQLMVLVSSVATDTLSTQKGIDFIQKKYLSKFATQPQWVDGSGLSRYNLITPSTTVGILQDLFQTMPQDRLFSLMAIGNKAGTLKRLFQGKAPFIFAKTGTLSNNYNLSGYMTTQKGKVLIFSFMTNHYVRSNSHIRQEIEKTLTLIHESN
jgi:serine-type D-Ala-D-Ala carboxypeptidase/endopeptidase (penicillin-binding protein 4)